MVEGIATCGRRRVARGWSFSSWVPGGLFPFLTGHEANQAMKQTRDFGRFRGKRLDRFHVEKCETPADLDQRF